MSDSTSPRPLHEWQAIKGSVPEDDMRCGQLRDQFCEAFDHLAGALFADPPRKLQAARKAATEWWLAQDRIEPAALEPRP